MTPEQFDKILEEWKKRVIAQSGQPNKFFIFNCWLQDAAVFGTGIMKIESDGTMTNISPFDLPKDVEKALSQQPDDEQGRESPDHQP